jgi:4'-phosphopantetheinyl transferase
MTGSLSITEVHVWSASLDDHPFPPESPGETLSADEILRADRLRFPAEQRRFRNSHRFLRRVLAPYVGLHPRDVPFSFGPAGKPELGGAAAGSEIAFNLTHSGDLALLAVVRQRQVGIDLERVPESLDFMTMATRYFSRTEADTLGQLPESTRLEAFLRCWTRKEAYAKGRGGGMTTPFNRFSVTLAPGTPASVLEDEMTPEEPHLWRLYDLAVPAGHIASLAVTGDEPAIIYRQWP